MTPPAAIVNRNGGSALVPNILNSPGAVMNLLYKGVVFTASLVLLTALPCLSQNSASQSQTNLQSEKALIQQGRLTEASAMTLEELRLHPSVEGFNLLGIIASEEHDNPKAIDAFQQALKLAPDSAKTHTNLGNVYVSEKKLDLADKEFRTALRLDPKNQEANYNLGILLMTRGFPIKAIEYFERIHPANPETRFSLVRANLRAKRTADALRLAATLSTEAKDNVQLHFSLGVLLASENQYKAAQFELEKADALQPGSFEILFNLGQAAYRNGDNQNADLALSRALKLKPESPETLFLLAEVCTKDQRPLDALDLLVRANKLTPNNPDILYTMAQISISQKYYEDAIPLLKKAMAISADRTDIRASLGESYFKADKIDKSIQIFTKLVQSQPSSRAYSFLGLSNTYLGRFEEAKLDFHNCLALDPYNSFCLFQLGYISKMQGDSHAAEVIFLRVLRSNQEFPNALLELANIRIDEKRYSDAAELLRKYVQLSNTSATGYYKLAMVEKNLHQTAAAEEDLAKFQTLSKDVSISSHPYDNLFEYLDSRSKLAPRAKAQQDLTDLIAQIKLHPDQPEVLYALSEAYLKLGKIPEARTTITQLDKNRPNDFRVLTEAGVLLARYGLYDDAIQHFQAALQSKPGSNDINFDLADAYFRKTRYSDALDAAMQVTQEGRKDDAYLALLGDIYAHLGDTARAEQLYRSAITRNPDNDQCYLSLALLQFRGNDIPAAKQTLLNGQARIPGSGKIMWGLGLASAINGDTPGAAKQLERAVEMLPEWPGAYSTLGVFYFQTGQITKATEVLDRFKSSSARAGLDTNRIEEVLAQAPVTAPNMNEPLSSSQRIQLLQFALFLADKTP